MKKFIKKTILFGVFLTLVLSLLDIMVTKGLRQSHAFEFDKLTKIYNGQIDANLIVNGSSKALCQVDPKILDELLSVQSYNFGMNGTGIELQNLDYTLYRKYNKKPEYLIQIVSNSTLGKKENMHEYKRYAPYLNDSLVRETAQSLNGFNKADFYIPFIRYSGFSIEVINGLSNFVGVKLPNDSNKKYKGYSPHNTEWNNSFEKFKKMYPEGKKINVDNQLVQLLNMSIKEALEEKIKVVMVYPPTYFEAQAYISNREDVVKLYHEIATNNGILFLDFSSDELTKSKKYFYDSQHLNKKGAEIFTKKLSLELKKKIDF